MKHIFKFREVIEKIEREVREWLGDMAQPGERIIKPGERIIDTFECGGVKRFIAYGVYPTNPAEATAFISAFLGAFEYGPRAWKKTWPEFLDVMAALERHSTLASFAAELDVSTRTAQEIVKQATMGGNFRKYQAEKASRGKSRLGAKFRRRRRRLAR